MLSEADLNPGIKVEIYAEDNIAVCSEICEEIIAELKNDDVLRVDTKNITKCESFSTKTTVSSFFLLLFRVRVDLEFRRIGFISPSHIKFKHHAIVNRCDMRRYEP
jgi:hypothetical protein